MAAATALPSSCSPTLSSSFSLRSGNCLKIFPISLPIHNSYNKKSRLSVKAMAEVKFKGTMLREKQLTAMIEKKVLEAKEICEEDETSVGCKVAWDEVEEVSQAKADLRRKLEKQDPLESFCSENPETDECRIYED